MKQLFLVLLATITIAGCGGGGGSSKSIFDDPSTASSPQGSVEQTARAYSPDGNLYAQQAEPPRKLGEIVIYNRQTNKQTIVIETLSEGFGNSLKGMAWSRDSKYLAVMYHGGTRPDINLYNVQTGKLVRLIGLSRAGSIYFHFIVFSSDNKKVLVSGDGQTVNVEYPSGI